jgi:hypothetical protein
MLRQIRQLLGMKRSIELLAEQCHIVDIGPFDGVARVTVDQELGGRAAN